MTTQRTEVKLQERKWIGHSVKRVEDSRLITGTGKFVDDLRLPGIHWAAVVRSPYAHAKIRSIRTSKALRIRGVVGVLTGEDVAAASDSFSVAVSTPPKFYAAAVDKTRYVGEPVAVVVAKDRYAAEDAAELVEVEYEPLPVVVDVEDAIASDAPLLHEYLGSNVAMHRTLTYGNPHQRLKESEVVLEEKFYFPRYTSCPLETYAIVASFDQTSGLLNIWSNFQGPWTLYAITARALRLQPEKVRFLVPRDIGGGFGIKTSLFPHITLISLAAMKFHVPVKYVEDRKEHLLAGSCQPDRVAHMRIGARKDGTLTAIEATFLDNMGGYLRAPEPGNLLRPIGNFVGPYKVRDVQLEAYAVLTNKCPTGPNRGYGCQHLYFSLERMMDLLAAKLNMDPAEIRFKNFIQPSEFPYTTPTGGVYDSGNFPEALKKALELAEIERWKDKRRSARKDGRYVGIGIAVGVDPSVSNMGYVTLAYDRNVRQKEDYLPKSGGAHIATVRMDPGGKVFAKIDSNPQGQSHETVITQVIADELGVKTEDILVNTGFEMADAMWTVSSGTYSSRFSAVGASAAAGAARKLRKKLLMIAARILNRRSDELQAGDGFVYVKDDPRVRVSMKRVAGAAHWNPDVLPEGVEPGLFATDEFNIATLKPPDENDRVNSSGTYGFMADLAMVEVMPETGKVEILDYVTVHDVGTILNPRTLEGQVHGAFLHGLAGALYEELIYSDDGQLLTSTFVDYLSPSSVESFSPRVGHIESPSPFTLLGAKGGGEGSSETTPVALANAIADALSPLGIEIKELPLPPQKVWTMIRRRGSSD